MSTIGKNIRVLRGLKKISQEQMAEELGINRSRLGAYEESRNEPPIDLIIKIAAYFQISIDALVRGDLSHTPPDTLMKIGNNRILFPIKVDSENKDMIEVVPVKASAGYLNGRSDPQFVQKLDTMKLPFKIVGKHRAFGIKGDSMPPIKDGAIIVCKYIESFDDIKDGQTYVALTYDEGLVYKRLYHENKKSSKAIRFQSDNPAYKPYIVNHNEILEVWGFVCSINLGEVKPDEINIENVIRFLQSYKVEMGK